MNNRLLLVFAGGFLSTILSYANSVPSFKGEIPFDFMVGNIRMPAGVYVVDPTFLVTSPTLIRFTASDGQVVVALSHSASPKANNKRCELVFNRYGDEMYFVSEIWVLGSSGRRLAKSKSERELVTTSWKLQKIAIRMVPHTVESDAATR